MKTLHRYVLKEIISPMGLGFLVFTFVFLVGALFKLTKDLMNSGLSARLTGELVLLILPSVMAITVPMAVLVGILLGMGRLAADREILAMKASGISLFTVLKPVVLVAGILTALMVWSNFKLIPYLNLKLADLTTQVLFQSLSAIPAGVPYELPMEGQGAASTILIDSKDPDTGKLHGITMLAKWKADGKNQSLLSGAKDLATSASNVKESLAEAKKQKKKEKEEKQKNQKNATREEQLAERRAKQDEDWNELLTERVHDTLIVAESGEFDPQIKQRAVYVRFTSGSIHLSDPDAKSAYDIIQFDSLSRGIVPTFDKTEKGYFEKAPNEMSVSELRSQISVRDKGKKYTVELYRRFSVPLACIAFALIAFPLAVYVRPTGKAVAFALSFLLILVYYGLQEYGVALTHNKSAIGPAMIFMPNLLISGIGIFLLYRVVMK